MNLMEKSMVETTEKHGFWPNFYEPFRNIGRTVADWFTPSSEAAALEDCYEINIELAGVKADDISLELIDNRLTVKGEKSVEREDKGRNYYFSEREYGAFQRSFRLPQDADDANISANFEDGVLKLRIGKLAAEKLESRKISIQS